MAEDYEICNLGLSLVGANVITALAATGSRETIESNRWYAHCRDAVLEDHDWNFARKYLELTELREIEFDAGATAAPAVGATITAASGETATIVYVYLVSGTFVGTNATGIFVVSDLSDVFIDNEAITWSGGSAVVNEPDGMGASDYNDWTYCYQYPSDCIKARKILDTTGALTGTWYDPDEENYIPSGRVKFEVVSHVSKALKVILTDKEDAILKYTAQITDTSLFSQLFIDCLARKLACEMVRPLRKNLKLHMSLTQEYSYYLSKAKTENANEGYEEPNEISSFQRARG